MAPVPSGRSRSPRLLPAVIALCALATSVSAFAQTSPPAGAAASSAGGAKPAGGAAKSSPGKGATADKGSTADKTASDDKNAVSYSVGVSMGEQMHGSGITTNDINAERLAAGVRDALSGKAKLTEADHQRINALLSGARDKEAGPNERAASEFLAANAKKPGVITTASGLQYKVLSEGTGASPKATDSVTVNYRGTLANGTEFDSSYKRGQPATFPVNGVIPGWTEALQLMKPGGKYELWVPPQLAYGKHSPAPVIPAGSMLIFEVELVSAKPGEAAGAPPAPSPK